MKITLANNVDPDDHIAFSEENQVSSHATAVGGLERHPVLRVSNG